MPLFSIFGGIRTVGTSHTHREREREREKGKTKNRKAEKKEKKNEINSQILSVYSYKKNCHRSTCICILYVLYIHCILLLTQQIPNRKASV
jgi:hypothetical protein